MPTKKSPKNFSFYKTYEENDQKVHLNAKAHNRSPKKAHKIFISIGLQEKIYKSFKL